MGVGCVSLGWVGQLGNTHPKNTPLYTPGQLSNGPLHPRGCLFVTFSTHWPRAGSQFNAHFVNYRPAQNKGLSSSNVWVEKPCEVTISKQISQITSVTHL